MAIPAYTLDIDTPQPTKCMWVPSCSSKLGRSRAPWWRPPSAHSSSPTPTVGPSTPLPDRRPRAAGFATSLETFEAGEEHKRMETLSTLLERAAEGTALTA